MMGKIKFFEPECACDTCSRMCHCPCVGTPDEIDALMDRGYAHRLCLDDWPDAETLIKPALKGDEGKRSSWETRSEEGCTFWIDGKCELHELGLKPLGGRIAYHEDRGQYKKFENYIERTWTTKKAARTIERWKKMTNYSPGADGM